MPRLRTHEMKAGECPAELRDEDHKVWKSAKATAEFIERHSLVVRTRHWGADPLPLQRHHAAAEAWVVSMGHFRTFGQSQYKSPDWAAFTEYGIPMSSLARARWLALNQ